MSTVQILSTTTFNHIYFYLVSHMLVLQLSFYVIEAYVLSIVFVDHGYGFLQTHG